MKYCSEDVSRKIGVLSTMATIAVVVIHSNSLEDLRDPAWAFWTGRIIAYLQLWAIPYFFMVSGFFFDRYFDGKSLTTSYSGFLKKKISSLAFPYFLWGSVFGFLTMTPLRILVNRMHGDGLLEGTIFTANGVWNVVDRTIGISGGNFIGAMWYIRLLLIVFITTPVWILLRRFSRYATIGVGLALVFFFSSVTRGGGDVGGESIGRFSLQVAGIGWILLGMAISAFRIEEVRLPISVVMCSGLAWCVMMGFVIHVPFYDRLALSS